MVSTKVSRSGQRYQDFDGCRRQRYLARLNLEKAILKAENETLYTAQMITGDVQNCVQELKVRCR